MIIEIPGKLRTIKVIHTLVWIFYNIVIFYMVFAVITGRLDIWLWVAYALVILEGFILMLFGFVCPLTIIARQYSDSTKANFDIYLPEWLAYYTKLIYTILVGLTTFILLVRLVFMFT